MRLLENLILLLLLFSLAWTFLPSHRRSRVILYLPFISGLLVIIHLLVEGSRWQMIPAYLLNLVLIANNTRLLANPAARAAHQPAALRLLLVFASLLLFILVYQLPSLIPVFSLPKPDGGYPVGVTQGVLVDTARLETFTPQADDARQVALMIWYPAEPQAEARPADYWLGKPPISRHLTRLLGLPFFLLDHLSLVNSNAIVDAPLASAQPAYPVILYSHGYRLGYLQQNTSLMETLASHGYIVISVAHPYQAAAVPNQEGNLIPFAMENSARFSQDAAYRQKSLSIWSEDLRFTLDQLAQVNPDTVLEDFSNKMDLSRVGVAGMSFGGSAATRLCLSDTRCAALLTLDSPQYEPALSQSLQRPALFFSAQDSEYIRREVYEMVAAPAYLVTIQGSQHYDFTDLSLVSPLNAAFGFSGGISGRQMVSILNQYSLAFFNRHLKDLPAPLLNGISADYPEVTIESRNLR
ncbi:MAG: hypothetical protein AB1453_01205 [Chloroflexota bacterium]